MINLDEELAIVTGAAGNLRGSVSLVAAASRMLVSMVNGDPKTLEQTRSEYPPGSNVAEFFNQPCQPCICRRHDQPRLRTWLST